MVFFRRSARAGGARDARTKRDARTDRKPYTLHVAEGTKLKPLRYYNSAVHSAAFVLPEFARAAVEPFVVPGTGFQ